MYRKCRGYHESVEEQNDKLHDDVETVTTFSYCAMEKNVEVEVKGM